MIIAGEGLTLGTGYKLEKVQVNTFRVGNLDLLDTRYLVHSISRTPVTELSSFSNPLHHGRGFIASYVRGGTITINMTVKGENQDEFMENIRQLYKEIYSENITLTYEINNKIEKTRVVCTSSPLDYKNYNRNFLNITLTFEYPEFVEDITGHVFTIINKSGNFGVELVNEGTAESDMIFYLVFKNGTNISSVKITKGDEEIIINQTFSGGDILKIDGQNILVTKNSTTIDFDGEIPTFSTNNNVFNFEFVGVCEADLYINSPIKYA